MRGCITGSSPGARAPSTRPPTRAPTGTLTWPCGWASCTPMAAGPGPVPFGRGLLMTATTLPPDGPVTFVASWLLHEVAETRADLDSSVIHEAVQRAVTLWPDEP